MSLLKILVAVLMVVYGVCALPDGAPAGACDTLTPFHVDTFSQRTDVPYYVDLSVFDVVNETRVYNPGRTYAVTLKGNTSAGFRGFFVQTRITSDDTTRVGVFAVVSGLQNITRLSSCPIDTDGITHLNNGTPRIEFSEVTFDWTAPAAGTGNIQFAFAVVQDFSVYWSDQRSEMIAEGGPVVIVTPFPTPFSPPPSTEHGTGLTFSMATLLMVVLVALLEL